MFVHFFVCVVGCWKVTEKVICVDAIDLMDKNIKTRAMLAIFQMFEYLGWPTKTADSAPEFSSQTENMAAEFRRAWSPLPLLLQRRRGRSSTV